jgi:hypothetical protein
VTKKERGRIQNAADQYGKDGPLKTCIGARKMHASHQEPRLPYIQVPGGITLTPA